MTPLQITDWPDRQADLPGWLDRRLVGPQLPALVAELQAVHGDQPASLDGLLGDAVATVETSGLAALAPPLLNRLLTHPQALLELQERVLIHGGPHWQSLLVPAALKRGANRLRAALDPAELRRPSALAQPWFVGLTTAAAVMLSVIAVQRNAPRPADGPPAVAAAAPGWGWQKSGAIPADVSATVYLRTLADGADAWFKQRPDSAPDVTRRLLELRQGCSSLMFAAHTPLADEDRQWLVGRCHEWASKLDAHAIALESGANALQERDEIDRTVRRMALALRTRAAAI